MPDYKSKQSESRHFAGFFIMYLLCHFKSANLFQHAALG